MNEWKLYHPLEPRQLEFAGASAEVVICSFYHGGDELYHLRGIPGTWYERCLEAAPAGTQSSENA